MIKKMTTVLIIILCFAFMTACSSESKWNDGVYEGSAQGMNDVIEVKVTVDGGKIKSVDIVSHKETPGVSDVAIERVPSTIVEEQNTEVDTVSGATISSKAIMEAVKTALSK